MGEKHLLRVLREYVEYYNDSRTHQALGGDSPIERGVERAGDLVATPILGGLHHRYSRAA
jgi:transposase InsO family protein